MSSVSFPPSLQESLELFLSTYSADKASYAFGAATRSKEALGEATRAVKEFLTDAGHEALLVKQSVGQGNWANVPWLAVLDPAETVTTQRGIYVVYLFASDMSRVYLTLNQGVTDVTQELGRPAARSQLRKRAETLREQLGALAAEAFRLTDDINLVATTSLAKDYEFGTIAYKVYTRGAIPPDDRLKADLHALTSAYKGLRLGGQPSSSASDESRIQYWIMGTGEAGRLWPEFQAEGIAAIGWDRLGDLRQYDSLDEVRAHLRSENGADTNPTNAALACWEFAHIAEGDHIYVKRGRSELLGKGTVRGPYHFEPARSEYKHTVPVHWEFIGEWELPGQPMPMKTLTEITRDHDLIERLEAVLGNGIEVSPPVLDLGACTTAFSEAIKAGGLDLGPDHEAMVRSLMASLVTKRFVILTGLSGSGKSQIALRLGQWFGTGRYKVVPVRPDWTGPDALFGYQDALQPAKEGRRVWQVPEPLAFMLKAAADPLNPYLLVLDEMNLAHVERYFADALSGMESREPCLPNLELDDEDGCWRDAGPEVSLIPIPGNLFVIGTVNVDETTYLFSPKVLDRANTFEFRVPTEALSGTPRLPAAIEGGASELVRGFALLAQDDSWHQVNPPAWADEFAGFLRQVHLLLSESSLEFGHRVYYEATRFAAFLAATDSTLSPETVLDRVVMQKVLPRLHGSRKRIEVPLCALGSFCRTLAHVPGSAKPGAQIVFEFEAEGVVPRLPLSFDKTARMLRTLRANQFTSFTD